MTVATGTGSPLRDTCTLVLSLHERPGALDRVVGFARQHGCDVVSLAHGPSERRGVGRMTLTLAGGDAIRLAQRLRRLVDVLTIHDAHRVPSVHRETALMRIEAAAERHAAIVEHAARFGARVADASPASLLLELTAEPADVARCIEAMRAHGLREVASTGRLAAPRAAHDVPNDTTPFHHQADGMTADDSLEEHA